MTINCKNRIGATYILVEKTIFDTTIQYGGKSIDVPYDLNTMAAAWKRWDNGALVQVAFSFLSADEREFIMTGMTADEWDELFNEDDEENDNDTN